MSREFQVIEAGSTGIHPCVYQGKWPNGHWWITADGDMCPSRPVLFRAKEAQQTSAQMDAPEGGAA